MRGFHRFQSQGRHSGHRRPGNLPAELNRFIGRRAELAELEARLAGHRLVTVTGVGGVGKSRCALALAARVQERFCDGVWLVEPAALHDPELLEHAVVEALELTDQTRRAPRSVLIEHLAERETLLVLDGFDPLAAQAAGLVRELLRRAPRLKVLATGRRPLGVAGEQIVPLSPMAAPDPGDRPADGPAELGDAAELFADRAAAVVPGFAVDDANRRTVAEICHRLEGIPLALELAAGRLRSLGAGQLLQRLDDRFRLLTGDSHGAPAHHQALRTAIGWSHELCTPRERLLWSRLSVFAGSFDLEAAEYLCSGPGLPSDEVLEVLSELVAQSVVIREDDGGTVRYRMLDTLRDYGATWLAATGDRERLRRRLRDWCTGLVTWCELEWFSPRQGRVAARVEGELANLRAALECALEDEDPRVALYLTGTLWFYWAGCGRLAEGRHWLGRALEAGQESPDEEVRLRALWVLGYVAVLQGDTVGALSALHECQEGAQRAGNARAAAYGLHRTGCLALISDDMERAERLLRDCLERYRAIGELNSNVLMGQVELGMAMAFRGDLAGAVRLCEEVRDICEDHGERWARNYALYVLGFAALTRGDTGTARELLAECLTAARMFQDPVVSVLAIEVLALLAVLDGDAVEAAVLQGAAGRLWRSVGLPLFGSHYFNEPHIRCERQARERLGARRYAECVREGARLPAEAAVARALRHAPRVTARPVAPEPWDTDRLIRRRSATAPPDGGGEPAAD
jgi:predicted ATPase